MNLVHFFAIPFFLTSLLHLQVFSFCSLLNPINQVLSLYQQSLYVKVTRNLLYPRLFLGSHFICASSCFYLKHFLSLASLTLHLRGILINMLTTNFSVFFFLSFSEFSMWKCLDPGSWLPIIPLTTFPKTLSLIPSLKSHR